LASTNAYTALIAVISGRMPIYVFGASSPAAMVAPVTMKSAGHAMP
jgi:hypothetical protein